MSSRNQVQSRFRKQVVYLTCFVSALLFIQFRATAQYASVPVTGYNSDIVANGVGAGSLSTSATTDGGVDNSKFVFVDGTYQFAASGCSAPLATGIFPANNQITSVAASGLTYTLPSYTGNNALRIPATGTGTGTGTLNLTTPVVASKLYLLLTSGGSAITSGLTVTVTFTDNTTQTLATDATTSDWCTASATTTYTNTLSTQYYRLDASVGGTCGATPVLCPYLAEMTLSVTGAGMSKSIASITLTKTSTAATGAVVNVIAVGMQAPCSAPASQATALTFGTPALSQIPGSFTAAAGTPTGYLVIRYPSGATPTSPVNGVAYLTGQALGTGVIVQQGATTSFTATGLSAGTTYDFYVYSYNTGSTCGGPVYNATSPLSGSLTTVGCTGGLAAGTYSVGPTGTYPSLTSAFSAVSSSGIAGPVTFELQSAYVSSVETFPLTLSNSSCFSASNYVTIRPELGASGLTVTSANATATIDINSGNFFRIDGRPGGTGTTQGLTIQNTSTSGVAVRLINDAYRNRILYCYVQGVNSSPTGGVIQFAGTTGTSGNDTNSVTYCNISGTSSSTTPATLIYSSGTATTSAHYNNNDTVANCNFYDFYASGESNAFKIGGSLLGNANWAILNNSIYQTTPRTVTANTSFYAFNLNCPLASGYTVSGNYIGGSSAQCGGGAFTITGSGTGVNSTFQGMYINMLTGGATSTFSNNTFANFSWTNSTTATNISSPGAWAAIRIVGGALSVTGNTIGSLTGNSISLTTTANSYAYGIIGGSGSATSYTVSGNTIAGITTAYINSNSTTVYYNFYGISINSSTSSTTYVVDNNTVGSALTNSIRASALSTGIQSVKGIECIVSGPKVTITNNTVQNLANSSAATSSVSQTIGISTTSGTDSIASNTVTGLTNSAQHTNTTSSASVIGISQSSTAAAATVSNNTVYNLSNTAATGAVTVTGIYFTGTTSATNLISGNLIHGLSAATAATSAIINGLAISGGTGSVQNNMIRVGLDNSGTSITTGYNVYGISETGSGINNYYHNSVYVGGSSVTSANSTYAFSGNSSSTTARSILNNIFYNARSNSSGSASNYGIRVANVTNLTSNYNIILTGGTGGTFGLVSATPYSTLLLWQGATSKDALSISSDPQFIAPTAATPNLHINASTPTPVEGAGITVATVTTDFDGQARSGLTPVDIGADAGNFTALDAQPPVITYTPLSSTSSTGSQTLSVTITDVTGVPTTGILMPRIYYKKMAAGSYTSAAGSLTSGTSQNGIWSFTIDPSLLGGVVAGDSIYYYVIAQDGATTPNIASNAVGAVATDVNNVTTPPALASAYRIISYMSGTVSVGAGNTYTTLTDNGGLFQAISINGLSGDLTVLVTSDLTESGTNALTQWPESGVGNYRVRIVPDAATERLIMNTSGGTFLRLSGAKRVTFDGRVNGSGRYLRLRSTLPAVPTFTFINDAQLDSVAYCILEGNNTSTGNILFAAGAGGTGNDQNVVTGNLIRDLTANPYTTLVTSTNTGVSSASGTVDNSDNIVSNNEFLNCIYNGVNLNSGSTGNNWTITGNSFYNSATFSNANPIGIITISAGTGHLISSNSIGGSAADRSGAALTNSNSTTLYAIQLSVGTGTPTVVSNNTISNIATTGSTLIAGINATSGTVTIQNNIIGGGVQPYDTVRTGASSGLITIAGATATISGNTLKNYAYYGTGSVRVAGIYVSSGAATVTGNTIDSIRGSGTGTSTTTAPVGILLSGGTGHAVTGNTVSNIYSTNTGTSAYVAAGIVTSTAATNGTTYSRNRIYNIYAAGTGTGSSAPVLYGLYISSTAAETASNNQISIGGNTTGQPVVYGIYDASSGTHNYYYNSVYLSGTTAAGANNSYAFYRSSTAPVSLRNNILYNGRTTSGTGFNFALGISSATGFTQPNSNYNLLVSPDVNVLVQQAGTSYSASSYNTLFTTSYNSNWMADVATIPSAQLFTNTASGDLGIVTANAESWYANGRGIALPAMTTDFNNAARSAAVSAGATDIGSVEFNTSATPPSATASAAPAPSTTTTYSFGGRQIASLTWGAGGTPPSSIDVKYYPGADAPSAGSTPHFKGYYDISATGGTGYSYTVSLSYDTSMLGNVTSSATARLSKYDAGTGWITPSNSSANPVTGLLSSVSSFTGFSIFTGSDASQPLPLALLELSATTEGLQNRLQWTTTEEERGDMFELQRSADGKQFEAIVTMAAKGTASTYTFRDATPQPDVTYYRVRRTAVGGIVAYSRTVSVRTAARQDAFFSLSPNPATDAVTVTLRTLAPDARLILCDITGRTLHTENIISLQTRIDLSTLKAGIYFLKYTGNGRNEVVRLVKE